MEHFSGAADLSLESVLNDLSVFRETSTPHSRIPEDLWDKAVKLCARHPIGRVHRVLKLSYTQLKKRVQEYRAKNHVIESPSPSPFVELKIADVDQSCGLPNSQYLIELSRSDGARMRIYSSKNNPLNMNKLCSTFLKN